MSKPTARVVVATLIVAVLITVTYLTVQGAFAKAETAGARTHEVSGLQTNFNHDRSSTSELQASPIQNSVQPSSGGHGSGGCESEHQTSPLD